jgi:hexosaminidase
VQSFITAILLSLGGVVGFAAAPPPAIIPQPLTMGMNDGAFKLTPTVQIHADAAAADTAAYLAERLRRATGYQLPISRENAADGNTVAGIVLTTRNAETSLGAEGYSLLVSPGSVIIRAPAPAGLFYGVQSLLQLLPPEIYSAKVRTDVPWMIPAVRIEDQPRFQWRGLMLDVSRHFFSKDEVKDLLNAMALHKINTFHWHLVDDQGWRIEIKKYPKLTQVGAWRSAIGFDLDPKASTAYGADGRYGGFYTQDDIREVVAYAKKLHITIVPEIEMPGHSIAALAAYPELSCTGKAQSTDIGGGVQAGVYCGGKEAPFEFLQNVLAEVFEMFPGKYVHVGGDEVPKDNWKKCDACQARIKQEGLKNEHELQSYFIRRIEKFVNAHDKTLIGWSEIREGGLAKRAALMDWIGGGREAANDGHDVVMTPIDRCYFDYYQAQGTSPAEPHAMGGCVPLEKVYAFEPVPDGMTPEAKKHFIGTQGNVWTEFISNIKHVQYMVFPRLTALAEVTWSPKEARNFDDFKRRLKINNRRLDLLGVNYRDTDVASVPVGEWHPEQITAAGAALEWDATKTVTAAGKFTITLAYTKGAYGVNIAWLALLENSREISRDTHAGFAGTNPRDAIYTIDVPAPKPGARYTIRTRLTGSGGTDSQGSVYWNTKPLTGK